MCFTAHPVLSGMVQVVRSHWAPPGVGESPARVSQSQSIPFENHYHAPLLALPRLCTQWSHQLAWEHPCDRWWLILTIAWHGMGGTGVQAQDVAPWPSTPARSQLGNEKIVRMRKSWPSQPLNLGAFDRCLSCPIHKYWLLFPGACPWPSHAGCQYFHHSASQLGRKANIDSWVRWL